MRAHVFAAAVMLLAAQPRPFPGEPLAISGRARRDGAELAVEVRLRNVSTSPIGPLSIEAELIDRTRRADVHESLAPREERALEFRFPFDLPRPGTYPLLLLIEQRQGDLRIGRRSHLLLSLGAHSMPALHLSLDDATLEWQTTTHIKISSADARPHRARLRVLSGRGLLVLEDDRIVEVPATGSLILPVRVLHAGAKRATRHGLLAVAAPQDGSEERTSVASAVVEVRTIVYWLPRLRWPLAAIGFALIVIAVILELRPRPTHLVPADP
jgi:hypothetical protein